MPQVDEGPRLSSVPGPLAGEGKYKGHCHGDRISFFIRKAQMSQFFRSEEMPVGLFRLFAKSATLRRPQTPRLKSTAGNQSTNFRKSGSEGRG